MTDLVGRIAERRKGKSRIITLGNSSALSRVTDWVSTGCAPIDYIMGGGVPIGRMMEIYGDTSTGKSLLGGHILAETQAVGGIAVLLDTECAIDLEMMETIGVDADKLIYSVPETVEEVFDDIQAIIEARNELDPNSLMVIVWDSVAATSSQEEIDTIRKKGLGAKTVATHARLISKMCRVMKKTVAEEDFALVVLNQTRERIGVLFGDKVSTFGGKAFGFYSSIRLELALRKKIGPSNNPTGIHTRVWVAKNKVAAPFGMCQVPMMFDAGIDNPGAMLPWLKELGVIETKGSWSYLTLGDDEYKFQGADGWADLYAEIGDEIDEAVTYL